MHIGVAGNPSGIASITTQSKSIAQTNVERVESKHQPQSSLLVSTAIISGADLIKGNAISATKFVKTAEKHVAFGLAEWDAKKVEEIRIVIDFKRFMILIFGQCVIKIN